MKEEERRIQAKNDERKRKEEKEGWGIRHASVCCERTIDEKEKGVGRRGRRGKRNDGRTKND
jgi:hypothetical protein